MRAARYLLAALLPLLILFFSFASPEPEPGNERYTITVLSDGSFDPANLSVKVGDTVEWVSKIPGTPLDAIIPVEAERPAHLLCKPSRPWHDDGNNEFTGPMPRAVAGLMALSPIGRNSAGWTRNERTGELQQNGPDFKTMDHTLQNPAVSTIFIRFRWNTIHLGPGRYNWTELDREIDRAVKAGKFYSISFKAGLRGTPDWIFEKESCAPYSPVMRYHFVDKGEGGERVKDPCGVEMDLGSPADPAYRKLYFDMWRAVAAHIKERNDWYRALAWVKPSGANLITHENRLPYKCEPGCLCNTQVWSEKAKLKPADIVAFYVDQFKLLRDLFPQKDISYALIQSGFPQLTQDGRWQAPEDSLIKSATLVEDILAKGRSLLGDRFAAQHNGVRPWREGSECPSRKANGCPNWWVVDSGNKGSWSGFQTINRLETVEDLDSTLKNVWRNSEGTFLEIYEDLLYRITDDGGQVSPNGLTLADWNRRFIQRRDKRSKSGPQYPDSHMHVFVRPKGENGSQRRYDYINGSRCTGSGGVNKGTIILQY